MKNLIPVDRRRRKGITLIEMCIVLLLITILLLIAMPQFMRARSNAQVKACKSHLWHIQEAKQRWGMENRKAPSDTPVQVDLQPTYLKAWPECPAGGAYTIGNLDTTPTCSIGGEHAIQ